MSPIFQSRDVPPRGDISTFRERGSETFSPGMVGSRLVGLMAVLKGEINLFGLHNFGLSGLLVEDSVFEWFAFVEDGDLSLGVQADRHRSMAHGISRSMSLDLINSLLELEG